MSNGDDATDEHAFATLSGLDLGIKVGPGHTLARFRASDTAEVTRILASPAERRSDWLAGCTAPHIHHHSMLSEQRAVTLVNMHGRVIWLCLPRVDSGFKRNLTSQAVKLSRQPGMAV